MTQPNENRRAGRGGFTLLEVLVVISVLAVLVAILLPGLQSARRSSQAVVCRSNVRQMGVAVTMYAQDYRDQVWPAGINAGTSVPPNGAAWARIQGPDGSVRPGLLYEYVDKVDKIGECPSNRRATSLSDHGLNMFDGNTPLDFDYTFVANTQGARLDRKVRVGHLRRPEAYANWALPPLTPTWSDTILAVSGLPIFVEEHTRFWNENYTDGLWSNADQLEVRHNGGGNIAFLEGHVEAFKPIHGDNNRAMEPRDLDANDFYVRTGDRWVRLERQSGTLRPYGWINEPEQALP